MDELYFEEGYLELRYFAVIANASSGSRYFLEGYLSTDYFEYRGSFASVTCDFEVVIIGTTKEFEIAVQSIFDTATVGVKTVSGNAVFNSEFTQTGIGVRGQDTDLFAFSDAAIQAQVDRIRDNNIDATAFFSVSSEVSRIRALDTDAFGGFSFVGNTQRSRATEMETQAAFSFAVSEDLFKDFGVDLSDEFTQSVQEDLFKAFGSVLASEFIQSSTQDIFRDIQATISCQATFTADFRVVRDAHLTGTGVAAIVCDAVKIIDDAYSLETNSSLSSLSGKLQSVVSTQLVYSLLYLSRNAGGLRPRNLDGNFVNNLPAFTSSTKVFGTHSLAGGINTGQGGNFYIPTVNEDFYIEVWLNPQNTSAINQVAQISNLYSISLRTGALLEIFGVVFYNNTTNIYAQYRATTALALNTWHHIAIVKNQTHISYYVNGQRVYARGDGTYNEPIFNWGWGSPQTLALNKYASNHNASPFDGRCFVDEFMYVKGTTFGYDPTSTTITVPSSPREDSANVVFLHHFDNNILDDVFIRHQVSANLNSNFQRTVSSTVNYDCILDIQPQFAVTATIGKLEEINLIAFSDGVVIADAAKITENIVTAEIEASQSTDAQRLRDNDSSQSAEFTVNTDNERLRDNGSQSLIAFEQQAQAVKTIDTGSTIESTTALTALGGRLEEINLVAFSDGRIEVSVRKFTSYASDISSEASVDAVIGNKKPLAGDLQAETSTATVVDRLRDNDSSNNINASVSLDAGRLRDVDAAVSTQSKTTNTYIEEEQGLYIDDGYFTEFEIIAQKITDITQNLAVECEISAEIGGSFFAQLVANTNADITANAVKQVSAEVDKAAEFAVIALASPIRDFDSNISAEFVVFANGVTGGEINAVLFDAATLSATAEATKPFDSNLSSVFTQNTETIDSLNGSLESYQDSEFAQTVEFYVIRDAVIQTESIATNLTVAVKETAADVVCESRFEITVDGVKATDTTSNNDATFTISNTPVKTANGVADITAEATASVDAVVVISSVISTDSIASQLSAVARVAAFFVNADVVSTVSADVNVVRSAVSDNQITAETNIDGGAVRNAESDVNVAATVNVLAGVVKPFEASIQSAMAFVAGVREIRTDDIVYVIPGEGWTYTITGEGREYDIIGETRMRRITAESRSRTINGESRIYNIE